MCEYGGGSESDNGYAQNVGVTRCIPVPRPSGALRASRSAFLPICRTGFKSLVLSQKQMDPEGPDCLWRRGWDSNPRRAINPCWFSRPVHSTALPPLQTVHPIQYDQCIDSVRPCTSPSGCIRFALASKIVPDDFVKRSATSPNPGDARIARRRILRAR